MKISGRQVAAARSLLGWSLDQLAAASDVSKRAINRWEVGETVPHESTIQKIVKAIEDRGVEFTNGGQPGVRYKAKPATETEHNAAGE